MKKTLISAALCTAFSHFAYSEDAGDIEKILVIAPIQTPLDIKTDPKLPRQPLPAQDGSDLLSSISGFSLIKKGAASSDPVFRGMAGSRLNILTDGGTTLGGCGNRMDPPTAYITPQSYDTLTVIKGPQTVLYGPGNSAATILFERDKYRLEKSGVEGFTNAIVASANRTGVNTDLKAGNQTYFARIAASHNKADNYEDGAGNEIHSAYDKWNLDTELAYTPNDDQIVSLTLGRSDGEVAYADRALDGSLFDRTHGAIKFDWSLNNSAVERIEGQIFYNYVDHIMDNFSVRRFTPSMMRKHPVSMNPDRRTVGAKLVARGQTQGKDKISAGIDHQQNRHRTRVSMNQVMKPVEAMQRKTDGEFKQLGVFAEYENQIAENQQWVSGIRADRWQAQDNRAMVGSMMMMQPNPTAFDTRKETLWSGFSRLQGQSDNMSYFAGVGHVQRFPDYWELLGPSRMGESSPSAFNLEKEATSQLDIGLVTQYSDWQGSVSVFYNQVDNFILIDNLFAKMGKEHRVTRNIDTESYGLELDSKYSLTKSFSTSASISWVRGSNLTDSQALAQQPPLEAKLTLDYQKQNWQLGMLWRLVKGQHRVAIGQGNIAGQDVEESAGFGTLSINANYSQNQQMDWSFGIDNLLDKEYSEHLSRAGAAVSGYQQTSKVNAAGITAWLNFNYRF